MLLLKKQTPPTQDPASRRMPHESSGLLAVSGPRGVAAVVLSNGSRALLFDLEEDEARDDDDDDEDEEDDEDADVDDNNENDEGGDEA